MRKAKGALMPPVRTQRLRRGDLYRSIRAAILDGALRPGEQLASTRQAANDYRVSRGLMEEVYDQLVEEGFLERLVGRGTFVSDRVGGLQTPTKANLKVRVSPPASRRGTLIASNAACREPNISRPFNGGIADTSEFPWKLWCRLQARAMRELTKNSLYFADPRGLPDLRDSIARYLAQFRGMRCSSNQIVIFNSSQQALNALAILLLDKGDGVWIEDPGYLGARAAFEIAGAKLTFVSVDTNGLSVDDGARLSPRARLAYVTPSHQYPAGVALSLERRVSLLDWAKQNDSWIIEDDYDGEFRYEGQPQTSLYSLDPHTRVIYLGTLNKAMFVSLRLAFLVVPDELVEPIANLRTQLDGFTSPVQQMTMSLFMDDGFFSTYLRRMRAVYGAKRAALIELLEPLGQQGWTWSRNPVGMHLLLHHKDGKYVRAVRQRSSLELALLSSYRAVSRSDDGLFLRYGSLDLNSVRAGAAALAKAACNKR